MSALLSHPATRGHRHECGRCGHAIKKAKRVFEDIPFCDTCYHREFLRRPCERCAEPAILHQSQETGLCRRCIRLDWRCLRCKKSVERAALLVGGEPVCPGCRRHFPPFPKKSKPKNHATCAMCRKYRRVVRREDDKAYCSRCALADRSEEVKERDIRYWTEAVARRQVQLSATLATVSVRKLFGDFVEAEIGRTAPQRLCLKLKHHVQAFIVLEKRLPDPKGADEAMFLAQFTSEEMHRWERIFVFLAGAGCAIPLKAAREAAADRRRIEQTVAEVARCREGWRVATFAKHIAASAGGKVASVKTQRVSVRAAAGLVQTRPADILSQDTVKEFLRQKPGQRAALAAFMGFLRVQGIRLVLPPKKASKHKSPAKMTDLDACIAVLRRSDDYAQLRAALIGSLVGLFGLELKAVIALPRSAIQPADGEPMVLSVLNDLVPIDERLLSGFRRYMALRDARVGGLAGPLFPGRVISVNVDPATLAYQFQQWGVSPRRLRMAGNAFLERA